MTTNKTIRNMLLTVLVISATMMSGCVEFRDVDTVDVKSPTESIYMSHEIPDYLKTHNISVNLDDIQVTIHSNNTITVGNETGNWIATGLANNKWSCATVGIDTIEYIDLHDGRIASAWDSGVSINGVWFR